MGSSFCLVLIATKSFGDGALHRQGEWIIGASVRVPTNGAARCYSARNDSCLKAASDMEFVVIQHMHYILHNPRA